jgi:tRNA threonylcarbamoyladenosine biosynthesis protein TsaE
VILAATSSMEATSELAAAVAELARPGDIVVLCGDLGAGKTAFAKGFGAELGVEGPITSPTFTLVSQYGGGRLTLFHLDVYRLAQMLDEGGVTLIEWGDQILSALPADYLEVRLALGHGDDDRVLSIETVGQRWSGRQRALTTALAQWAVPDPRVTESSTGSSSDDASRDDATDDGEAG